LHCSSIPGPVAAIQTAVPHISGLNGLSSFSRYFNQFDVFTRNNARPSQFPWSISRNQPVLPMRKEHALSKMKGWRSPQRPQGFYREDARTRRLFL
jgi:hypothetical protein